MFLLRIFLGTAGLAAALAGAAQAQTLADALAQTYDTNPTLKAARAQLSATDENFAQARAGLLPSLSAGGSAQYSLQRFFQPEISADESNLGFGQPEIDVKNESTTFAAQLTADQTIYQGGQNFNAIRQANAQIRAGRASLLNTEQQVLLSAVAAYMDVFRDQAVVELGLNNVNVLQRQLQAAQDRFEVGEVTRTDVAQSEARLSGARANLATSRGQLAASRAAYARIVGSQPGTLAEPPELPPVPATYDEALSRAVRANPALHAARESERATRRGIAIAEGALLPTITTQLQYQVNEEPVLRDSKGEQTVATARINIPIFSGGANYSRIRQARHTNNQSRFNLRETQRQVEEEATNAWETLLAAQATIRAAEQQVRANEIAFEGVEQEAFVGSRTTLDVLDAEQELLDSRVGLVRAERDEYVAGYRLLSAVGSMTAQDLGLDVNLYDPERNKRAANWKLIGRKGYQEE